MALSGLFANPTMHTLHFPGSLLRFRKLFIKSISFGASIKHKYKIVLTGFSDKVC